MTHPAQPAVLGSLTMFEKTCVYCGARLHVLALVTPESSRSRLFGCPDCGKSYRLQDAASEPEVRLLHGRTDGKEDRYQDTMF